MAYTDERRISSNGWPPLTMPQRLIRRESEWRYPAATLAGSGVGRLLVWHAEGDGHIAAVTDLDIGASVTNSAEYIWASLVREYGEPMVLVEHYLGKNTLDPDGEHLDQVHVLNGRPRWQRIWPVPTADSRHEHHYQWLRALQNAGLRQDTLGQPGDE